MGPGWQTLCLSGANFDYDIRYLAYRPNLKGGIISRADDRERHEAGI